MRAESPASAASPESPAPSASAETVAARPSVAVWSAEERRRILAHGPWPKTAPLDPTNRFDGQPAARAAGRRHFYDRRHSRDGSIACVDCHRPEQGFTDARATARGLAAHHRNTMPLHDLAGQRWFGWDGGADSLWAASLRPLFADIEMGAQASRVREVLLADPATRFLAEQARDDREAAVNAAKAIAAWLAGIRSPRTAFDAYRDALANDDPAGMARYPAAAARGLRMFIGRGRCSVCHLGPRFTNDEFHDIGRPFFIGQGRIDAGRLPGIRRLQADPFNLLSRYNDEPSPTDGRHRMQRWKTASLLSARQQFGAWKTPTLRGLMHTAPYTHDGSLATLAEVVDHYSDFDPQRMHTHGEAILVPLHLNADERADLVAFLRSLSADVVAHVAGSP
ncbi:MAG: cytochrome c peroxidase [Burkholderiaceae bacterium]